MALGRRAKPQRAEEGTPLENTASSPNETFLDKGCVLAGELRFGENVRIEGRVEGQIQAERGIVVGAPAEIDANIEAETLEVYGTVVGDIRVARRTTLHKTARVEGEIRTTGIVIEEGARFKGRIVIGSDAEYPELADAPVGETHSEPESQNSGSSAADSAS